MTDANHASSPSPVPNLRRVIRSHEVTEADKLLTIVAVNEEAGVPAFYEITVPMSMGPGGFQRSVPNTLLIFQRGAVCQNDFNGVTVASVIAVLIDLLECYQRGDHACAENDKALYSLRWAMQHLRDRTTRRQREHSESTADAPRISPQTAVADDPPKLRCHCRNVAMGSHEMSVVVPTPEFLRGTFGCKTNKDAVGIDLCIVPEILWLWSKGVLTLGSCCGHGKQAATICVDDSSIAMMHELGYQLYPDHPHVFYSRSIPRHDVQPPRVFASDDSLEQLLFDLAKRAGSLPSGPDQDWALHFSNRLRHILSNQSVSEPASNTTDRVEAS